MVLLVSDEVRRKTAGREWSSPALPTIWSSAGGMTDRSYSVKPSVKMSWSAAKGNIRSIIRCAAPAGAGAFNIDYVRTRSVDVVGFFDRTASK